jgi:GTP-binding protein
MNIEPDDPLAISGNAIALGERLFAKPWDFLKSAPTLEWLPPADRPEIAFAGRSNVGKSSLINAITRVHNLARFSNTPGRTQELNYFLTPDVSLYLVDMPGYGFADAPKEKVDAWTKVVRNYLRGRPTLKRVFVLIDSRHGIKKPDLEIFALLNEAAVSFEIIMTKADKLKVTELDAMHHAVAAALAKQPAAFPRTIATSSETTQGIDLVRAEIVIAAELSAADVG